MKQTVTLDIAGTKFRLVADAEAEQLRELASVVNERVKALQKGSRTASSAQLLAMVALGLADDLRSSEAQVAEIDQLMRRAIQGAIQRIDQHIDQDADASPAS